MDDATNLLCGSVGGTSILDLERDSQSLELQSYQHALADDPSQSVPCSTADSMASDVSTSTPAKPSAP